MGNVVNMDIEQQSRNNCYVNDDNDDDDDNDYGIWQYEMLSKSRGHYRAKVMIGKNWGRYVLE